MCQTSVIKLRIQFLEMKTWDFFFKHILHVFLSFVLLRAEQQVAEGDAANKDIVTTSFKLMAESLRQELADLKRDLKSELQAMKQTVPIEEAQQHLPNQPSHIRMDVSETTAKHSLVSMQLPRAAT